MDAVDLPQDRDADLTRERIEAHSTLREANAARQREWDAGNVIDLAYRGNEFAGEAGEVCNVIKKLERERHGIRGSRDTVEHLAEELADVVICADLIAMTAGIDLNAAVEAKFNATSEKVGLSTRLALSALQPASGGEVEAAYNAVAAPLAEAARQLEALRKVLAASPALQPVEGPKVKGGAAFVLDPGHKYDLRVFDGEGQQTLTFMKREGAGYPGNVGHYPGTNCQEVIRALIDRVQYLDGQIAAPENVIILNSLRDALVAFELRAARRHGRELTLTDDIEAEPTCVVCGHVGCSHAFHATLVNGATK